MRDVARILFGSLVAASVAGCGKPVSTSPAPTTVGPTADPGKPEQSVPAATAGEPDLVLVEAGRQQLRENQYTPMPVYSRKGVLGMVRLVAADSGQLQDAIVVFEDKEITDSRLKLENGYVFFNVDQTGPVQVGDFELKQGECVLFSRGRFSKLELVVSVDRPHPLSPEVAEAWRDAGAGVGWGRVDAQNLIEFQIRPVGRPGELPLISFPHCTDSLLAKLPKPREAFGLDLSGSKLTDAGIKEVGSLINLHWLKLSGAPITDAGLKELSALENLQWLGLGFTKLSDEGIQGLAPLNNLRFLDLENSPLKGTGLRDLKSLQWLYLGGSQVTDAGLNEFSQLKNLQWLSLSATPIADAALQEISGLEKLQTLFLAGTQVTDAGLKELAELKSLQTLSLFHTKVTDMGLRELTELENLQTLELDFLPITDAGLKQLSDLKSLRSLSLEKTTITAAGLKELTGLVNLQTLYVGRTEITEADLSELQTALPDCKIATKSRFAE